MTGYRYRVRWVHRWALRETNPRMARKANTLHCCESKRLWLLRTGESWVWFGARGCFLTGQPQTSVCFLASFGWLFSYFLLLSSFFAFFQRVIRYRYSQVDQKSPTYYSTDWCHRQARHRKSDIAAWLGRLYDAAVAAVQCNRNSAILPAMNAGCGRGMRGIRVPISCRQEKRPWVAVHHHRRGSR